MGAIKCFFVARTFLCGEMCALLFRESEATGESVYISPLQRFLTLRVRNDKMLVSCPKRTPCVKKCSNSHCHSDGAERLRNLLFPTSILRFLPKGYPDRRLRTPVRRLRTPVRGLGTPVRRLRTGSQPPFGFGKTSTCHHKAICPILCGCQLCTASGSSPRWSCRPDARG